MKIGVEVSTSSPEVMSGTQPGEAGSSIDMVQWLRKKGISADRARTFISKCGSRRTWYIAYEYVDLLFVV